MATLITVGNSSGETGRCDAKCYDATGPVCKCCCGGANHGAGEAQATENTKEMGKEIIKANCDRQGIEATKIEIPTDVKQYDLF